VKLTRGRVRGVSPSNSLAAMSEEPKTNAESRLQAYAAQRRQEANGAFEMPPQTRRSLHEEIQHRFPAKGGSSRRLASWWQVFWPYAALGASLVLAVGVFIFVRDREERRGPGEMALAKAEKPENAPARAVAPEVAPRPMENAARLGPSVVQLNPESNAVPIPAETRDALGGRGLTASDKALANANTRPTENETGVGLASNLATLPAQPPPAAEPTTPTAVSTVPNGLTRSRLDSPAVAQASPQPPDNRPPAVMSLHEAAVEAPAARTTSLAPIISDSMASSPTTLPGAVPAPQSPSPTVSPQLARQATSSQYSLARPTQTASPPIHNVALTAQDLADLQNNVANYRNALSQTTLLKQQYVQNGASAPLRRNFNSPPRIQLLNNFRFEQNGNTVRLIDADDSVYEGQFQALPASAASPSLDERTKTVPGKDAIIASPQGTYTPRLSAASRSEQQQSGLSSASPLTNEFPFTARGTNKTTRQSVVVYGRLVVTNLTDGFSRQRQQLPAIANQNQSPLNNVLVQGRVVIGSRTQMDLNAIPTGQ